ncbi:required for drug-induced death protein 1 [Boleophthalmus pectinirostris]|uniref:required for drug-induced death protein 1 n=1 Tax=Boleophthalmus pectinirostris TaxID=150288 RepID=UPI000A1C43E8|nr:required for drug-induced death protein 1 [Boleophthalmus pectinirostris]
MGALETADKPAPATPLKPKKTKKTSKDVHFCALPDKYEPLEEEHDEEEVMEEAEERRKRKEEKKRKKKIRYKKYRKNVGKALRFSWRCLVAGLQSLVPVYMAPAAAAVSIVTTVNTGPTPR